MEATHQTDVADPKLTDLVVKDSEGTTISSGDNPTFTVTRSDSTDTDSDGTNDPIGDISTNIENKKGSTLPETGGIGTTLFYVIGGVLVLAAVVLLVTRKRVDSAK